MYQGTLNPVSNQADLTIQFEVDDGDTGAAIDLTGASIQFDVRMQPPTRVPSASFLGGTLNPILSATTANGKITIDDIGVFSVTFSRPDMQTLQADDYDIGCIITINGITNQFIIGVLPVLDGIVS